MVSISSIRERLKKREEKRLEQKKAEIKRLEAKKKKTAEKKRVNKKLQELREETNIIYRSIAKINKEFSNGKYKGHKIYQGKKGGKYIKVKGKKVYI